MIEDDAAAGRRSTTRTGASAKQRASEPVRNPPQLVYGPSPLHEDEGIVVEAQVSARWDEASRATTWEEFVSAMYEQRWEEFIASDEENDRAPDDEFDIEEWLSETIEVSPQELAFDIGGGRIAEIVRAHPDELAQIRVGGASPGGNISVVAGPLSELDFLAGLVDADSDGFSLVRDDELTARGTLAHLFR